MPNLPSAQPQQSRQKMKTPNTSKLLVSLIAICVLLTVSMSGVLYTYSSSQNTTNNTIQNQKEIIDRLNSTIADQQALLTDYEDTVSTLNSQVANLSDQVNSLKSKSANQNSQSSSDASTIANLQNQLSSANTQINSLNTQIGNLQKQITQLTSIIDHDKSKLQTLVFHVCEKGENYEWGRLPNAQSTYNQLLALNTNYQVLLLPEYMGNLNWTETLTWIASSFGGKEGIPVMLEVFGGGNDSTPTPMLNTTDISAAMATANVEYLRFAEVISWHLDHPERPFPTDYIKSILEFCRTNNLKIFWTEWKIDTLPTLQTYIEGYEDIVTVSFSTNSGEVEPPEGFMQLNQTFQHWGGSIQAWYWETRNSSLMDMPPSLLAEHALFAKTLGAEILEFEPYWYFFDNGQTNHNLTLLMNIIR